VNTATSMTKMVLMKVEEFILRKKVLKNRMFIDKMEWFEKKILFPIYISWILIIYFKLLNEARIITLQDDEQVINYTKAIIKQLVKEK